MTLTCPHCGFSRHLPVEKVPSGRARVTCPKCRQAFRFGADDKNHGQQGVISCPTCGSRQPAGNGCENCGTRYAGASQPEQREGVDGRSEGANTPVLPPGPDSLPKAGFWVRFVALFLDSLLVWMVELALMLGMGWIIASLGGENLQATAAMSNLAFLVVFAISTLYYIFFTGYGGQTPGKMAVRVKVIRTDGREIGFGRAVLREVLGKFISAMILGVGYLMAGFDRDKQGLHDKIADTYVVKL